MKNCVFRENFSDYGDTAVDAGSILLYNNIFSDHQMKAISIYTTGDKAVHNNLFHNNTGGDLEDDSRNIIYSNAAQINMECEFGDQNRAGDPMFEIYAQGA